MTAGCVIYARDLEAMSAFYARCLGLTPVDQTDGYRSLEAEGWTLWLVSASDEPGGAEPSDPPARRTGAAIKPAFTVPSIDGIRQLAPAHGATIDPLDAEWVFGAQRHCDGVDPEGNVIQLIEPVGDLS